MKVVIHLSGANVVEISSPDEAEVEVRQYHKDFWTDRELYTDDDWPGCRYEIEYPRTLPASDPRRRGLTHP